MYYSYYLPFPSPLLPLTTITSPSPLKRIPQHKINLLMLLQIIYPTQ